MNESPSGGLDRRGLLRVIGTLGVATTVGCLGLGGGSRQSAPTNTSDQAERSTLTVRLRTPSGEPVTEVVVFVTVGSTPRWVPSTDGKTPGDDGIVRFALETGEYTVRTRSQEYTDANKSVTVTEDTEVTITLERGVEISTDD